MKAWAGVSVAAVGTVLGQSAGVASVTKGAAGIYDITLATNYGIDSTQCSCVATEVGTLAASGASSFAISHTSDTVKRVTCLREGAAGAASALTDIAFSLTITAFAGGDNVN